MGNPNGERSAAGKWLALTAALLGWMFDGMEMGLFPLVARPALAELLGLAPGEGLVADWYSIVTAAFLVGAATGGVVFGWLGDKVGRVRAMTLSVLVYSLCSGLSAASAAPWQLAALRFVGALGMGGEWALGVALVMEVWPNASRAWLAGLIGAFGNLGYTCCGLVAFSLNRVGDDVPGWLEAAGMPANWAATLTANDRWRLLMLMGAVPALLTMLIRLFVPESEKWEKEKEAGATSFWSGSDLLGVVGGAAAAGGLIYLWADKTIPFGVQAAGSVVLLAAVTLGYLHPARRYLGRSGLPAGERRMMLGRMLLGAGLSGVALLGTWAGLMWMYPWVGKLPGGTHPDARPTLQIVSSIGAALGCVLAAVAADRIGRRPMYAVLCLVSMASMFGFYRLNSEYNTAFVVSAGWLGLVSASFYGWLPLYLPELFRTSVRATGQGFAFNFGRIIAAVGTLQLPNLLGLFNNDYGKACALVAGVYVVGLGLIALAPETRGKPLPE
jgi:SHS family sialic acid transporter-like MFS transporter